MWALTNRTPYSAERNWIRDKQGVHHWLVAVKATFDIKPDGKATLADEQPPPLLAPAFRGDPASSSLRLDSDLLAIKPTTDVLLEASAHAPGHKPTPTVPVSIRIGDIEKTLLVHGTRVYYSGAFGLTTTKPLPFLTRPIHYEWAFGGTDTSHSAPHRHRIDSRNPVGKGFAVDTSRLEKQVAHAIEYPDRNPGKAGPAGFGPIASFWSPRLERAGTYDAGWEKTKKPLFPDDYDERFALSAPDDQRPPKPLRGGEPVGLFNMTAAGVLRFDLPKIFLAFQTRFARRHEEHRTTLATVHIAPDESKLTMVWQGSLRVSGREVDYLDDTVITEKKYL
jgi:hypothetical protein